MLIALKLFLYFVLALASLVAFSRFRQTEEAFWKGVIAVFAFLGIGEILFQVLDVGARVRMAMQETGVYADRGGVQVELIVGVCVFVVMAIFILARTIPPSASRRLLAFWIAMLIVGTALDVISLHSIDAVFHYKIIWRISVEHILFPALMLPILGMLVKILRVPPAEAPLEDRREAGEEPFIPTPSAPPPVSAPQSDDGSFRSF